MPSKEVHYLSRKQVAWRLGVAVITTYRMVDRGELPAPRQISKGRVGWPSNEIDQIQQNLPTVPRKSDPPNSGMTRDNRQTDAT